jgi:DNA-binding Lrp family transcriptional regulator
MPEKLPNELVLSSPSQWRAIASTVRLQIVDRLRMLGPSPVPRIAEALDRPADGLYHHIRILQRAGIIRKVSEERVATRLQAIYSIAAKDVRLPIERSDARTAGHLVRITGSLFRTAERGVAAALRTGGLTRSGPDRDLWCRIHTVKIDARRLNRLNALLAQVEQEIDAGKSSDGTPVDGRTMSFVIALWPVVARRRFDEADTPRKTKPPTAKNRATTKRSPRKAR